MPERTSDAAPKRGSRLTLLAALGIDNVGSGLFLPLVVVYATRVIGLPLGVAGTVISLGTMAGLAVPPLAGRLVDRVGPRPVVVTSQLLQAAGAATYLVADGVALTFAASILLAAGQQTFYSSLFALISDVSGPGPKDHPFAIVAMVRSAAFGTGALTAGVLLVTTSQTGLRLAVAVNAVSFLVAALLLAVFVHVPDHQASTEDDHAVATTVLRNRPYLALIGVTCLMALSLDFFLIGMPVFILETLDGPEWLPGVNLALLTVVTSTSATVALRVTRAMTRIAAMKTGALLLIAWAALSQSTVWFPDSWRPGWLIFTSLVIAAGNLIMGTRVNALAEAAAPRATRGRHLAAFQYAFTVAGVVAPAIVALFAVSTWAPWLIVGVSAAVAAVAMPLLGDRLPRQAVDGRPQVANEQN
ncbi:MAG: MFS transporter [Actinomycetota bacterium]|nr:MFS transporter [Actinomycetota bacterium]